MAVTHEIEIISNTVTPFTSDGKLDEQQIRDLVKWQVDSNVGVMCNSPGSGMVHSVNVDEFKRVCEITMEVAGDKVPTYTMTPELHNTDEMLEYVHAAVDAKIGEIQLFQLMGGHGMKATRDEQLAYWRKCLSSYDHPTTISVHFMAGYAAPPDLLAQVVEEFPHVRTVLSYGNPEAWVIAVRKALPDHVRVGGHFLRPGIAGFAIGMTVVTGAETNIIPKTCRAIADGWIAGDQAKAEQAVTRVQVLFDALRPWGLPNGRSLFMAQKILGLPGGRGAVRPPLVEPDKSEFDKMSGVLHEIGVRDWE